MEIRIKRSTRQEYAIRKASWNKIEVKQWFATALMIGAGLFFMLTKSSINGGPFVHDTTTIIFGALCVGFGLSNARITITSKYYLFKDFRTKIAKEKITLEKEEYILILTNENVISEGPKIKQIFNWDYFTHYRVDEERIYFVERFNPAYSKIIIDKSEITLEESQQLMECFRKNWITLKI
jgi:hypothetical protein